MRAPRLSELTLSQKLPAVMIGLTVAAVTITTSLAFFGAKDALDTQVSNKLQNVAADRALEVEEYVDTLGQELAILATSTTVIEAIGPSTMPGCRWAATPPSNFSAITSRKTPTPLPSVMSC